MKAPTFEEGVELAALNQLRPMIAAMERRHQLPGSIQEVSRQAARIVKGLSGGLLECGGATYCATDAQPVRLTIRRAPDGEHDL